MFSALINYRNHHFSNTYLLSANALNLGPVDISVTWERGKQEFISSKSQLTHKALESTYVGFVDGVGQDQGA